MRLCPTPATGVRTRRKADTFFLHDTNRDLAYELNGTAGRLWMLFNR